MSFAITGPMRICISAYLRSSFGPKIVVHDGTFESTSRQHPVKAMRLVYSNKAPYLQHTAYLPVAVPRPTLQGGLGTAVLVHARL